MLRTIEEVRRSPGPAAVHAALEALPAVLQQAERDGALPDWLRGVWLSGSYAVGRETPLSDLDLRADVRPYPEILSDEETWERMYATQSLLAALSPAIEPVAHVGPWDEFPIGFPLPLERWVPSFACGRALWTRPGVRKAWAERAGGALPDPAAALTEVRRQRAERVIGYDGIMLGFAAVSFAHGVLAALRIPPPAAPEDVPLALSDAGLVRRRDAEWVDAANRMAVADVVNPRWQGLAYPERGWDFVAAASRAEREAAIMAAALH